MQALYKEQTPATHSHTHKHTDTPHVSKQIQALLYPERIQAPPVSKQMFSNFCPCWDIECEQMGARKGGWEGKTRAGSNVAFQLNFSSKKSSKPQFWSWLVRQKPPIVKFSERAWEEIWWVSHSVRLEWSQFQFLETEKCFFTESWTCGLQKKQRNAHWQYENNMRRNMMSQEMERSQFQRRRWFQCNTFKALKYSIKI